MKKSILTVAAIIAFGFANAQETKFGVKAGLNIANQKFEADGFSVSPNSIIGVQVGGFAEINVAGKFAIQPEVLFSTEGSKLKFDGDEIQFNLSYINIPVMAKFYAAEKFSIHAGPQLGFLVSAKGKYKEAGMGEVKEDIKDAYKSVNFGLNFGAGYEFTDNLLVDIRYNVGLSDVAETNDEGVKTTGSVFSIALGYKF
ncbi:porin family protein [Flavobacterium sp. NG2]|uniref:porin family protein n=1 Tax=Flavobacterium sp. NG2 TaxID=3097547 RepID=UPI002A7F7AD8|nr:porin family protein [Flavobacterium sp. NG2]WPR70047.1 porin family protein [Flavobacterium sp. NG2]